MNRVGIKNSARTEYGLRALVELALLSESGKPVHASDLSQSQGIPEDYLSQLLAVLRNGGLIKSVRGVGGGYRLARSPETITLAEVIELYEGPMQPVSHGCRGDSQRCQRTTAVLGKALDEATGQAVSMLRKTTLDQICVEVRGPETVQ